MKTILKLQLMAALLSPALSLSAQTDTTKKACVKIDIVENGKETKIDTCFAIPGLDSLQNVFDNMHFDEITKELSALGKEVGGINIQVDSSEGPDGKQEQVIINEKDSNGQKEIVKIVSNKNSSGSSVVITSSGENGKDDDASASAYSYNSSGGNKMIIKSSKNGACTIIINEDENDAKDGKKTKKVKVTVFKKIEIKNVTPADKKNLPAGVDDTQGKAFKDLVISPNPTDGDIRIKYKATADGPLNVKVYDANGRNVYNTVTTVSGENADATISLGGLSRGIYFIQLSQGDQRDVRKIVIK